MGSLPNFFSVTPQHFAALAHLKDINFPDRQNRRVLARIEWLAHLHVREGYSIQESGTSLGRDIYATLTLHLKFIIPTLSS